MVELNLPVLWDVFLISYLTATILIGINVFGTQVKAGKTEGSAMGDTITVMLFWPFIPAMFVLMLLGLIFGLLYRLLDRKLF